MSSYDDWVIDFKTKTDSIDKAYTKIKNLRKEFEALGRLSLPTINLQSPTSGSYQKEIKVYTNHLRMKRTVLKQHLAEEARMIARHNAEMSRLGTGSPQGGNQASRGSRPPPSMDTLHSQALDEDRRRALRRQREMETEAYRYDRWRTRQSNEARRNATRQSNFESGRYGRELSLNRMYTRLRGAGIHDGELHDRLTDLRHRLGSATSQTDLNAIGPQMRDFVHATNDAVRHQRNLQRELRQTDFVTNSLGRSARNMARSFASVYVAATAGREIYQNAKEMQNLKTALIMGTGSKANAAEAYKTIIGKAQETGMGIGQVSQLYSQIAINAKDAGLDKKAVNTLFNGITTLEVGYGLDPTQQKLVGKAFAQMLSKQSVQAEEFKNQLGDNAGGVMGMMVTAMGLEAGPEGMKKLTAMMKKGQVTMEHLNKFIELAKNRAVESGAWEQGINTITSKETRMSNAFKLFSEEFMKQFDSQIGVSFKGIQTAIESVTGALQKGREEEQKSGTISNFTVAIDFLSEVVYTFGEVLSQATEGFYELYKMIKPGSASGSLKQFLADREMQRNYYESMGAKSEIDKIKLKNAGMPGYENYVKNKMGDMGANGQQATMLASQYAMRIGVKESDSIANSQFGQLMGMLSYLPGVGTNYGNILFDKLSSSMSKPPVTVSPTINIELANKDEADMFIKKAMDSLTIPYK